ncbi:MAG: CPBP family intramembrane metalloprotease, partial [Thermoplasmata archaeon]|nr:CPBP family intramembrane metalloprotease [Thermoplasmata archaeon]
MAISPSFPASPAASEVTRGPNDRRYAAAVIITVAAIFSQYVIPQTLPYLRPLYVSFFGSLSIIYGIPIVAFLLLVGVRPLQNWASNPAKATWEGLRWYGLMSALSILVLFALTIVYLIVDPAALHLLSRPNPVLESARSNPWFWVAFSFAIGACEELIFRGWIFGYWRGRAGVGWFGPAVGSSALFAGVHLYYGFTYAAAAPLIFPDLFLLGFAFAAAVQASGGNLIVVAVLHGVNDAAAFLTLVSPGGSLALHYGVILVGLLIALIAYLQKPSARPPVLFAPPFGMSSAGGVGPGPFGFPTAPPPPPAGPIASPPPTREAG